MKHILLAAMLTVVTACGTIGGTGGNYQVASVDEPQCPTSQEQANQSLTRDQWVACYGDQREDAGKD